MRRSVRMPLLLAATAVVVVLAASALWQFVPRDRTDEGDSAPTPGQVVTVDVRNAGGVDGLARIATEHLRSAGFDVVSMGNAPDFGDDSTRVVNRVRNPEMGAAVARALDVRRIETDPDPELYVDVTVFLGPEWQPPPETAPPPRRRTLVDWLMRLGGGDDGDDEEEVR